MTTIVDVAKIAKVSTATVSNAFNKPDRVGAKTRQRVLAVAQELGFQPNLHARGLRGASTGLVGIIVTDIQISYVSTLARGIQDQLSLNQRTGLIINTDGDQAKTQKTLRSLRQQGVGAFILSPAPFLYEEDTRALLQEFQADGVPLVFASNEMASFPADAVLTSAQEGAKAMVRYLVECGHRKIAFVTLPVGTGTSGLKRWLGYQEGLLESGIPIRSDYMVESEMSMEGGMKSIVPLLDLPDPPTAVMAVSDTIASGIISQCHRLGVKVPDELSVVGYNDEPLAKHTTPALTTVGLPLAEIGKTAADLLIQRLSQPDLPWQKPLFDFKLIVRESAATLK